MFSPLIHSTTNYAKRKAIPRLFEPIRSRNQSTFQGVPSCQKCGLNSHCAELIDVTFYCRECAESERNAKQERKTECQSAGHTSISVNPSQSSFSPPDFKVGDLVECQGLLGHVVSLEISHDGRFTYYFTLVGVKWSKGGSGKYYPRNLRHAETEPQEADGWNLRCSPKDGGLGMWMNKNISVFHYPSTQNWERSGSNVRYASWHELKRALEEAK